MEHELRALGASAVNKPLYTQDTVNPALLEAFAAPSIDRNKQNLMVRIEAPEFTCLCPITGQPDYAKIVVQYTPRDKCVESKAFKLYLGSYRNVGAFHEEVASRIRDDLVALLDPYYLNVLGDYAPRGGIAFKPSASYHASDAMFG